MDVCIFLSKPRSGATVLRKMLGAHEQIFDLGEVFNDENEESFFHFGARRIAEHPSWNFPRRSKALFADYVEHCCARASAWKPSSKVVVLDVKYDHLHVVRDGWQSLNATPPLLDEIAARGWKCLHLLREDTLACVISNLVAAATGTYHLSAPPAAAPEVALSVDVRHVAELVQALDNEKAVLTGLLGGRRDALTVIYERMFVDDGGFSESLRDKLRSFLGVPDGFDSAPKLAKVLDGDYLRYVANRDELVAALDVLADELSRQIGMLLPDTNSSYLNS